MSCHGKKNGSDISKYVVANIACKKKRYNVCFVNCDFIDKLKFFTESMIQYKYMLNISFAL